MSDLVKANTPSIQTIQNPTSKCKTNIIMKANKYYQSLFDRKRRRRFSVFSSGDRNGDWPQESCKIKTRQTGLLTSFQTADPAGLPSLSMSYLTHLKTTPSSEKLAKVVLNPASTDERRVVFRRAPESNPKLLLNFPLYSTERKPFYIRRHRKTLPSNLVTAVRFKTV